MAKKQTLKQYTMRKLGWTDEEYSKQYDILRKKVAVFNKATGSSYSPARVLSWRGRYNEPSYAEMAINATPTRYGAGAEEVALDYVETRFAGLIEKASDPRVMQWVEAARSGKITAAQLRDLLSAYADDLHERRKSDPTIGS